MEIKYYPPHLHGTQEFRDYLESLGWDYMKYLEACAWAEAMGATN